MLSRTILFVTLFSLVTIVFPAGAQENQAERSTELKAEVPALTQFHTVIFKIWHTGWPQKDTAMLASLLPEVEKGVENIATATLPGILRDKKAAWDTRVKELKTITGEYRNAVEKKEAKALLDAAERLHSSYESLVRTIRPAMKELDEFHAVLYVLYHYQMPEYSLEKIKTSVAALKEKMADLNKAVLPERLKNKEQTFIVARAKLSQSVDALASMIRTKDEAKIKSAINAMHSDYEALERIF